MAATKSRAKRPKATRGKGPSGKGSRDRGAERSSARRSAAIGRVNELIDLLPTGAVEVLVPVLEKHIPLPRSWFPDAAPTVDWDAVRDMLSVLDGVVRSERGLESIDAVDVARFIHNKGTADDRIKSVLALVPVARAVQKRLACNDDAGNETNTSNS